MIPLEDASKEKSYRVGDPGGRPTAASRKSMDHRVRLRAQGAAGGSSTRPVERGRNCVERNRQRAGARSRAFATRKPPQARARIGRLSWAIPAADQCVTSFTRRYTSDLFHAAAIRDGPSGIHDLEEFLFPALDPDDDGALDGVSVFVHRELSGNPLESR